VLYPAEAAEYPGRAEDVYRKCQRRTEERQIAGWGSLLALPARPADESRRSRSTRRLTERPDPATMRVVRGARSPGFRGICLRRPAWMVAALAVACTSMGGFAFRDIADASLPRGPVPLQSAFADVAGTIDLGCPSPPGAPGGQSLRIKVVKWCGLDAPRSQWQIKLQLAFTNTARKPLDISLVHVRLAMTHFNPAKWTPPSTQPGQRPFKSTYEGRSLWLVPANPDGAAEPYPPPRGNFTFATHWYTSFSLGPGQTSHPAFHKGDVVFYVPRSAQQTQRGALDGVVGIAYVDGPDVIDVCPPERWPPKVPAASF
jgi:hypothetical protein